MTTPRLDARDAAAFAALLTARGAGYVPEWRPRQRGGETALVQIAARLLETIARRLEQAPAKNELAFLELFGVRLVPAQPARVPLTFELADRAADLSLPRGTRIAAPSPPGGNQPVVFETERATGLAVAKLREAVSLWPGRDQYIDHGEALRAGRPFTAFEPAALEDTPHALYLAHDTLLALDGSSVVTAAFDLTTPSSEYLDIRWEYWDGDAWRPFRDMRPACSNADAAQLDTTDGLRRTGAYRLEADCAATAKTEIGGISALWVRGRVEETLPADPARVLPEVESVRLSTEIERAYATPWRAGVRAGADPSADPGRLPVRVLDASGVPLGDVALEAVDTIDEDKTGADGHAELAVDEARTNTIVVRLGTFEQEVAVAVDDAPLELTLALDMPALERAVVDGTEVDLSKPFFPFGIQPQPGAALYFSHAEAFSKPGARLRIYVQPTTTPQDTLPDIVPKTTESPVDHAVSWEYWNGRRWTSLNTALSVDGKSPATLRDRGFVELVVPADIAPTTVIQQEALWMRVQLVAGAYGVLRKIDVATPAGKSTLSFFVPQPPVLADMRIGYTWQDGPFAPEHVLAFNDFRYADRTAQATWPGHPFQPFVPIGDATPGLYLGFDRKLPVDDLGLYMAVREDPADSDGPTLVWEYWDGSDWSRVRAGDETHDLRVPGIVSFIGPGDMAALARFGGDPRFWLRARLNEDGPPGAPTLEAIYANAVWAVQQQTVTDEPLGASTGQASQTFLIRQAPILRGQEIAVRELAGPRANVEWRILAAGLFDPAAPVLAELEAALAAEGTADVQHGSLRLRRDQFKHVTEVWVRWEERATLWLSGPADRHYTVDHARGRVHFGDGERGSVPPLGALVQAVRYRTGGGRQGNVGARAVSQPQGAIGGLEGVFNPAPAEGGSDGETGEQLIARAPRSLRSRGRAVTAADYETLAREASPSVAVARALPGRAADGRRAPGWVTLVITPQSAEPRPFPSFGLREQVLRYVAERAPADAADASHIAVTGPDYQPVDVTATLLVTAGGEAGAVERAAHDAIAGFLHPLRGGPAGAGWQPGEDVYASDLAAIVERVDGIEYARELGFVERGVIQHERLAIAEARVAVAGEIRVRLVGG